MGWSPARPRGYDVRAAARSSLEDKVDTRTETDSMGEVLVPADRYWGAQTQRSIEHFPIGRDRFVWGRTIIESLGLLKACAAEANAELGQLPAEVAELIVRAAGEVIDGAFDDP